MCRRVDYDRIAATYDRRYAAPRYAEAASFLTEWVERAPVGRPWLEVGCGTGHWLAQLGSPRRRALGLDRSGSMLAYAAIAAPEARLVRGDATQLPIANSSIGALLCMNALHHFEDKAGFVAEASRVLEPGGTFCSIGLDPHRGAPTWAIYDYFPGTRESDLARYPASGEIACWLERAGLVDCRARVAQHIRGRNTADRELSSPMLQKEGTSQLALLSDAAYRAGVGAIHSAAATARAAGEVLYLETDLELVAVTGRAP